MITADRDHGWVQVKRTCYAQSSQIRQIRKKMVEIMVREASSCDLKELVGKFIPESIGQQPLHSCPVLPVSAFMNPACPPLQYIYCITIFISC